MNAAAEATPTTSEPEKKDTLTSTLRLEIVKPLDITWDELGRTLRAWRAPLHRVLTDTVLTLELEKRAGKLGKKADGLIPAQTRAYQLASERWQAEVEAAGSRVAQGKGYPGDGWIAANPPGSMAVLGAAGRAYTQWQVWAKDQWKGLRQLPTFKSNGPIYIVSSNESVKLDAKDGTFILTLKIRARGHHHGGAIRLVVKPYSGSDFAQARALVTGEHKLGDCRIKEDNRPGGKRKWLAFVSNTFEKRERPSGRTMALHRGMRTFLTAAVSGTGTHDSFTTVLETGDDILRHKEAYRARRRSLGQQKRQLGAGARGHGRARREEHVTRLEDAEARWVQSKCREVAAHAMRLAERKGVSRILVEDWSNPAKDGAPELGEHVEQLVRSFPFGKLRECIEWAAKKRGFEVVVTEGDYNSRTCPACAHVNEQSADRVFRCSQCMLERSVDVIYAWNMLRRDGHTGAVEDANKALKRAASKLRKATLATAEPAE